MTTRALHLNADLYLPHYLELIAEAATDDDPDLQMLSQHAALLGDEARATAMGPSRFEVPEDLTLTAEPAIACIVKRARDKRIVILNEHHCISRATAALPLKS